MEILKFSILLDKNLFDQFKARFLLRDMRYDSRNGSGNSIKIDLTMDNANYMVEKVEVAGQERDEFGLDYEIERSEYNEVNVNFIDDYVPVKLDEMCERGKKHFIKELDDKGIYGDNVRGYIDRKIPYLNRMADKINSSGHLDKRIKNKTNSVIDELIEFLDKDLEENVTLNSKIPFNLSKAEVIVLFQSLYDSDYISQVHPNEFHRFIERNFKYLNRDGEYQDITKSKKYSEELLTMKGTFKDPEATINSLKKIFREDNFFKPFK